MSVNLSTQDKLTLRTAAYGAVTLLSAAGAAGGSPHRIATDGSIALASATGLVGHVLAEKSTGMDLSGGSVAQIADRVLPALTEAMRQALRTARLCRRRPTRRRVPDRRHLRRRHQPEQVPDAVLTTERLN
ncbi:hypothetical protein [Micromonospora sediminicola]|uniref:hypothetical protein n=1 Tax=Micromonospora sediminicola TaxID=946078 RepID=UPI001FE1D8FC|nr:hypothetical protein [Micromonospora sediminicola]